MSHIGGLAMVETGRASGVMRWHVLSLESMPRAQRSLEREEVETWAPLCQTLRRHRPRGAKHDVVEWHHDFLFPGYLLARLEHDSWGWVEKVDGVDYVLRRIGAVDIAATLPDWWVDQLGQEIETHGGALKITDDGERLDPNPPRKRGPLYAKGQRLRVTGGNFAGLDGLYVADAKGRITLLLDTLGRSVPVELPEALVIPA
jgi:transcription antitermination factor NusG